MSSGLSIPCSFTVLHQIAACFPHFLSPRCPCLVFPSRADGQTHTNTHTHPSTGAWWGEPGWAEAQMLLASLRAASSSRSRSLSSRGVGGGVDGRRRRNQACLQLSNNQHSREAHSPLLLLFTAVYLLPLPTASPRGADTGPLWKWLWVRAGCREENNKDNVESCREQEQKEQKTVTNLCFWGFCDDRISLHLYLLRVMCASRPEWDGNGWINSLRRKTCFFIQNPTTLWKKPWSLQPA